MTVAKQCKITTSVVFPRSQAHKTCRIRGVEKIGNVVDAKE